MNAHTCTICHAALAPDDLYPTAVPFDAAVICPRVPRVPGYWDRPNESVLWNDCLDALGRDRVTVDAAVAPRPVEVDAATWAGNGHRCDAWAYRRGDRIVWLLDWHAHDRHGYGWVDGPNAHVSIRWGDLTPADFAKARAAPGRLAKSRGDALRRIATDVYLRAQDGGAGDAASDEGRMILRAPRVDRWDEADHRAIARAARLLSAYDAIRAEPAVSARRVAEAIAPLL